MASIRERDNKGKRSYEVCYRDPVGKMRSKTFKLKTDARDFRSHVENAMRTGEWRDPGLGRVRFREYAEEWLAGELNLKPATRHNYALLLGKHCYPFWEDAPLSGIEPEHVQRWVKKLDAQGLSAGSVRNVFRVFSRVLAEAERHRRILSNPCRGTRLPKRTKREMAVLTPEEISRVAAAVEPRYRALILLAGWTGPRWGEIAALEVRHLNLLKGTMKIEQSASEVNGVFAVGTTKTGATREVPLPRFLVEELSRHLSKYPSSGFLFTSPSGTPLRKNWSARHFLPALEKAGVPRVRFHDLRHSCASFMLEELKASITQVSKVLGHSSPVVTLSVYSHLLDKGMGELKASMEESYQSLRVEGL